jgi:hypothetical protein
MAEEQNETENFEKKKKTFPEFYLKALNVYLSKM